MRRIGSYLCALLLGLGSSLAAHAGVVDAPGADLEVSLITYGPGAIYSAARCGGRWSRVARQ